MKKVLFLIFTVVFVIIYFVINKEENKIKDKMQTEAIIIAQSSRIFLSNLAIDELKENLRLDMKARDIRAIEIKDYLLDKNIIVAYKNENNQIFFTEKLPYKYKQYPRIKENIIEKKSYVTNKLGKLTLYYDGDSKINLINKYQQINFTQKEKEYLLEKKEIKMCIDPYWMPFEKIKDNKHVGITSDYVKIFENLIGIPIKLIATDSWSESLTKAKNRECDIFTLASKTKERAEYMDFTTPYINNPIVIATKIGIPFIENLTEIQDRKIAVVRGYSLLKILKKDYPTMDIVEVDTLDEGLRAVENNRIFAYLDTSAVINNAIQKDFLGSVTISGKIKYNIELSIATRNDEPILNKIFELALSSIDKDTKEKIFHKWIKNNYNLKTDYTLVYQLLFVSLFIILGTMYWNRKLTILNKELSNERDKAKRLTEAKSEFLANMSHEIRTPMNGIIGMSHLALQCDLDKKSKNYIDKIDKSAKSLLNIINDILDFSKMEAGKLEIEKVEFFLDDLIENVVNLSEININEKELKLIVKNDNPKHTIYYGDPLRLTQIIMNLLGNAIKFTETGTIIIEVKTKADNFIEFSIEDTGIGLNSNQIEKLFNSFTQAETSTTRKYGGTGLGLAISKQLVELLGGKIWVESEEGIGSRFSFEILIPQKFDAEVAETKKDTQKLEIIKDFFVEMDTIKILLVEDNYINQEIIKGLLDDECFNIDTVQNGKDAVEKIVQNSTEYHLILMDMKMPIMNGMEASQKIRQINKTIPIIALTANALDSDKKLAYTIGINDYLHKPIDIEILYDLIYKYIKKDKKSQKENSFSKWDSFQFLNFDSALNKLNNDEKLYTKILKDFKKKYQNVKFENLNDEEYRITIHTLKGLAGNIGADNLQELLSIIEENNDKEILTLIYKRLDEVMIDISSLNNTYNESSNKKEISKDIKIELFNDLEMTLNNKRPKQILLVLDKLEEYELEFADKEYLENIKQLINKYKYREALEVLKFINF